MSDTLPLTPTGDKWLEELLEKRTILPNHCHGEGENLCLDAFAAAAYVGCSKRVIYGAGFEPVPHRSKFPCCSVDYIRTYRLPELRLLRESRQQHHNGSYTTAEGKRLRLRKVARQTGLSYRSLLKELREPNRLSLFTNLHITPVEMRSPQHGNPELTILETEAVRIKWAIDQALKRGKQKGYLQTSEIAKELNLKRTSELRQLGESLKLWSDISKLKKDCFLHLRDGKITTRVDKRVFSVKKLYLLTVYEGEKANQLWRDLDARAGTNKLRALLSNGSQRVSHIHEQMHAAGFPDHQIYQAVRLLKVVRRIESFRGPHVYELRKTSRKNAQKVVESILKDGPKLVGAVKEELDAAGWSFHSPAIKKAVAELQIQARCGPGLKRWWCKPGQTPPATPFPSVQRAIDFVTTYLGDGKPHPLRDIYAAAAEKEIKSQRLIDAVPFLTGLERKKVRDAKRRRGHFGTWRLPQFSAAANGASSQTETPHTASHFHPSPLQDAILRALDSKSMTADELESKLKVDRARLYYGGSRDKRGGLTELIKQGLVKSGKGLHIKGYFRPDRPPDSKD